MPFTPKVQKLMQHQSDDEIKDADKSDTTFSAGSLQAALRAAGSVIAAIDAVVDGTHRNAFCCVRPPGHHAGANGLESDAVSCGFCIFNNVAIGALHALREHSSAVKKVAVIDFDVHHGNGTQAILEGIDDPSAVFFFSIHLCEFARLPYITVDMSARWHGQVATRAVIADCQCPVDMLQTTRTEIAPTAFRSPPPMATMAATAQGRTAVGAVQLWCRNDPQRLRLMTSSSILVPGRTMLWR